MVCFAKTGIRKRGENEKEDNTFFMHSCTNLQTSEQTSGYWLLSDYGVSALFFVVELSIIIKNKTLVPPAGTILYSPSDRQRERDTHGSFELDRLARKQYYSWQNVRIISPSAAKREKERKFSKKEIERRER